MQPSPMHLKVLLPFEVFADETEVSRIVAETPSGSFGLLPHRLDCVAALAPGILIYESPGQGEVCIAVDEGVLVKAGAEVLVSVRRAFRSAGVAHDLSQLRDAVTKAFVIRDAEAQTLHAALAGVESGFLRRLARFDNG